MHYMKAAPSIQIDVRIFDIGIQRSA